ncbi:MAG: glycerol-3-phosphate cytidylyltransferase [Bdellovibrionales bacterium]|nr:glycerol-3-phosphate cytidylyltransferase [Bdellovibrionales bacterium]
MKKVITYGTFDTLHYGHLFLLERARNLGDYLIVALSSDDFNKKKGKSSYLDFNTRRSLLEAVKYVDEIIVEDSWEQKRQDIINHSVDLFVIGNDWTGKFDQLRDLCEVHYLERTPDISSTAIKNKIQSA